MSSPKGRLILAVPNLLNQVSEGARHPISQLPSQTLVTCLSQARRKSCARSFSARLAAALGQSRAHIPHARLIARWCEFRGEYPHWLCASPVELRPSESGIYLWGHQGLKVSTTEAERLIEALNEYHKEDELHFYQARPDLFLLNTSQPINLHTKSLINAIGRDLLQQLPQGPDAMHWHGLMTEWQMLLHQQGVNLARMQKGEPPINGLWLWGEGEDNGSVQTALSGVISDDLAILQLAEDRGIKAIPWMDALPIESIGAGSDWLVLDSRLAYARAEGRIDAWVQLFEQWQSRWLKPALLALEAGQIGELSLWLDDDHDYLLSTTSRWAFWRRKKAIEEFLV